MSETINHIGQLKPDKRNPRKHNPRNLKVITESLHKVGFARSIVIDEDNTILAGNGVVEAATAAGIERVIEVDGDGDTIIAVRRSGLTDEQKQQLKYYDNRSGELADWDPLEVVEDLAEGLDLSGLWDDMELSQILNGTHPAGSGEWAAAFDGLPDGERSPFQQMTFTLHDTQVEQVKAALSIAQNMGSFDSPNENSNGNALTRICEMFITDYGKS